MSVSVLRLAETSFHVKPFALNRVSKGNARFEPKRDDEALMRSRNNIGVKIDVCPKVRFAKYENWKTSVCTRIWVELESVTLVSGT